MGREACSYRQTSLIRLKRLLLGQWVGQQVKVLATKAWGPEFDSCNPQWKERLNSWKLYCNFSMYAASACTCICKHMHIQWEDIFLFLTVLELKPRSVICVKQILSLSSFPTLNRHSWWWVALSHNQDFFKIISCLDYILRLSPRRAETLRSFGKAYTGTRIKDAQTKLFSNVVWIGFICMSLLGIPQIKGKWSAQQEYQHSCIGLRPCPLA